MSQQFIDMAGRLQERFFELVQENWLIGLAAVAVLTLLAWTGGGIIRWIFRRLDARVASWKGTRLRAVQWQRQELLSADDVTRIGRGAVNALKYLAYLWLALTYLNFVFLALPFTREIGAGLFGYVVGVLGGMAREIVAYVPSLGFLIILFFVAKYAVKSVGLIFTGIAGNRIHISGFHPDWASPTFKLFRLIIWAFALVVAVPYLPGSGSSAFQGVSIFFGVLLSLGGSGAVANAVSGTVLTYMNAFKIGDQVKIADAVGEVVEKTIFVTRVRTWKNVEIAIPNSMVMTHHIINYSARARITGVILHTSVTIGYDVPWRQVHELLVAAARETEGIEADPEPFVLQTSLHDYYVAYELNAVTKAPERMAALYSDLHQHIQDKFHEAGIEIASPHLTAVRDGNTVNVPKEHLPKDYRPAAFRLLPLGGSWTRNAEPEGAS